MGTRSFCVECRGHATTQHNGTHTVHYVSYRWRLPSKNNDVAWKRIAKGELLWDRKAVHRKAVKGQRHWNDRMFRGKEAVEEEKALMRKASKARFERAKRERELGPPICGHEWCMWSYSKAISFLANQELYEGCPR